ncbi:hypothetical protein [Prochlorococcus marinus]|uniref:hypothetical protein n=1 Tax=Prochlorococcus marinus TaxID=1219 RepID=UPI0022B4A536|nr:hypothetical protein [Prochlorococcus marinus]
MKIIAHRANINGSNKNTENTLIQIDKCISFGYDVEIDLRLIDDQLFLGHDEPLNKISKEKLLSLKDNLWVHCKNIEVLNMFSADKILSQEINYFWHQKDSYTLTSKGYIWSYPGSAISTRCIYVLPEMIIGSEKLMSFYNSYSNIAGCCTDYPNIIR